MSNHTKLYKYQEKAVRKIQHFKGRALLSDEMGNAGLIILGVHLDSRNEDRNDIEGFAPGADDNSSSIAAELEIARILTDYEVARDVIFAAFTGEEQGLRGSTEYANALRDDDANVFAMLNMDMLGHIVDPEGDVDSMTIRLFSADPPESSSRQLARWIKWVGESYADGLEVTLIPALDRPGRGGDHKPFSDNGYAAVRIMETAEDVNYQHNDDDIPENMSFTYHSRATRLVLGVTAVLANAPPTPEPPVVVNGGDGESIAVFWADTLDAVYIAYRQSGELYWRDVYYTDGEQPFIIDSLESFVDYEICLAAAGEEDLPSLFSTEVRFTPDANVRSPENFQATSTARGVVLTWGRRLEPNVVGYEIRRRQLGYAWGVLAFPGDSIDTYTNRSIIEGRMYLYIIRTRLDSMVYSDFTEIEEGTRASHHLGTMIIDATPDGNDVDRPDDQAVDDFYMSALRPYDIAAHWDRNDSMQVFTTISDADLAHYSTVLYHADGMNTSYASDTTAIRKYLENGGKIIMSGLRLSRVIAGNRTFASSYYPGDFLYDVTGIDTMKVSLTNNDGMVGATGRNGYPNLVFDSERFDEREAQVLSDAIWNNSIRDDITVIAEFNAEGEDDSDFQGKPVALKMTGDEPDWIFIDLPLYNMTPETSTEFIRQAMDDLDARPRSVEEIDGREQPFSFQLYPAYPNPFNAQTLISFNVPYKSPVSMKVFSLTGRYLGEVLSDVYELGTYNFLWQANELPSGSYLLRLDYNQGSQAITVSLIR